MATKPTFDYVLLRLGYHEFVMPKQAALTLLDACIGADIYKHDASWDSAQGRNISMIMPINPGEMPSISLIGPVQFHEGLENYKAQQEAKRKEKKQKEKQDAS